MHFYIGVVYNLRIWLLSEHAYVCRRRSVNTLVNQGYKGAYFKIEEN